MSHKVATCRARIPSNFHDLNSRVGEYRRCPKIAQNSSRARDRLKVQSLPKTTAASGLFPGGHKAWMSRIHALVLLDE